MDLNVATLEQLQDLAGIGEVRAQAIVEGRGHLSRPLTLLDLTMDFGIPGDVIKTLIDDSEIKGLPRHEGECVKAEARAHAEEGASMVEGSQTQDVAMMALASLQKFATEVQVLSTAMEQVSERQIYFESILRSAGVLDAALKKASGGEAALVGAVDTTPDVPAKKSEELPQMAAQSGCKGVTDFESEGKVIQSSPGKAALGAFTSASDFFSSTSAHDDIMERMGGQIGDRRCSGHSEEVVANNHTCGGGSTGGVGPDPAGRMAHSGRPGLRPEVSSSFLEGVDGMRPTSGRARPSDCYRWAKVRIPEFRGGENWASYIVQFNAIMRLHGCFDNDVLVVKLVEALRGPALDYFNSLPSELRLQFITLCTLFEGRFGRQDTPATTRSTLKTITQRVDEPLAEFAERTLKMASDGHPGMTGDWVQMLAVDAFLMGCGDKRSARSALDRDPKTVDEAMTLMKRFHGYEKVLAVERRVRTLGLEEAASEAPQVNRVQEEGRKSVDVGELNESIGKLTKLLSGMTANPGMSVHPGMPANPGMAVHPGMPVRLGTMQNNAGPRTGQLLCYSCGKAGHIAKFCRTWASRFAPSDRNAFRDPQVKNE